LKKRREIFGKATYDLDELKKFIDQGNFDVTGNCRREYSRLDYSEDTVLEIIGNSNLPIFINDASGKDTRPDARCVSHKT